jgi:hypothetical protein
MSVTLSLSLLALQQVVTRGVGLAAGAEVDGGALAGAIDAVRRHLPDHSRRLPSRAAAAATASCCG